GNLVGINTAILSHGSGGNEGVGFAIPMSMVKPVMDQILEHGKVVRGYLGVYIQDVTPDIAKAFSFTGNGGALVGDVSPNTPGARAGLRKGDIIVKLDGQTVSDYTALRLNISEMAPGTNVKLGVWRDGKMQDVNVTLGELPEKATAENNSDQGEGGGLQGVEVQDLTPDIAQQINVPPGTHGVVVTSVDPSSPAASSLSNGDVIQEINHKPISNVSEYRQVMAGVGKQPVLLLVNHGGRTLYTVVEPQ
ncbi:MAG: PDZ domain-containing protein, partial [Candidatus Acidiferrales bacterium]